MGMIKRAAISKRDHWPNREVLAREWRDGQQLPRFKQFETHSEPLATRTDRGTKPFASSHRFLPVAEPFAHRLPT